MNNILFKFTSRSIATSFRRNISVSSTKNNSYTCKLLVLGGGSGGCTIAAKFVRRLPKDSVIVVEPSSTHYYQPLFTLVGAGAKKLTDTRRTTSSVLPSEATWLQDSVLNINPKQNNVVTVEGHTIEYQYLVVALGLVNDYDKIPGLRQALEDPSSMVSTIYAPDYVEKTWKDLQTFECGDAMFTFPDTPIKCPGAPQKIAYLADSYLAQKGIRSKATISYSTFLPVIFGVKKYADALLKVVERKGIVVNYKTVLTEINPDAKEATFRVCEDKTETRPYNLLHVTPPMKTPDCLYNNQLLTDKAGYLSVDKYTLQHTQFPNIYGIGDCINTPNSKTGAAIAKQCYVLEQNLISTMKCTSPQNKYDGYGACPLVTSYHTCILAEFLYDGVVHETFPFDQVNAKESRLAYYMKRDLFPFIYWNLMLKGYYHGPEFVRKIVNPFAK